MTLFNDLWKTFKVPPPSEEKKKEDKDNLITETLLTYQDLKTEELEEPSVAHNLKALKSIIDQPKEEAPELRFSKLVQHLGEPESRATVRQERWPTKIHCPQCKSTVLKRIAPLAGQSPHNHRYHCLSCGFEFNDDTGTPMEAEIPPINIWMLCWYLLGCTDSISYIAAKLNLDFSTVERMVEQLQKTFHAQKPSTKLTFDEWNEQSVNLRNQLKDDLVRQYEFLNANVATAPKDTTEFRRQQNLRRTLSASTDPTSPAPGRGIKR